MRTFAIVTASALLLAAAIVEIPGRLWPDSHLALLIVAALALIVQGWLATRLVAGTATQPPTSAGSARPGPQQSQRREAGPGREGGRNRREQPAAEKSTPARQPRSESEPPAAAAVSDAEREAGTVKWFNRSKGFGFIVRESGDEIFVHQRSIRATGEGEQRRPALRDGQAVSFVVVEREKGLQADDVTPTS